MNTLLSYLAICDFSEARSENILDLVREAIRECVDDDECLADLSFIEECLVRGEIPEDALVAFAQLYQDTPKEKNQLEDEYRVLAANLADAEWQTSSFLEFDAALREFDSTADYESLMDFLEAREIKICEALDKYAAAQLIPEEVTAESVTGHQLLNEGLELWLNALKLAANAAESGEEWNDALDDAELGNRLLLAVQSLQQRVTSEAKAQRL